MEAYAAIASALIALAALVWMVLDARDRNLRKDDVFAWANRSISSMQSTVLICALDENDFPDLPFSKKAQEIVFETSILIEQGRIFFKNVVRDDWGKEKPEAYRGYRPELLDHLVVAHQIACKWQTSSHSDRLKMKKIVNDRLMKFVTLVRKEIGRERSASDDVGVAGSGINLSMLLEQQKEDAFMSGAGWLQR